MSINLDSVTRYEDCTAMQFRGRVFDGHGVESVDVMVDADGDVHAWDEVAGAYTRCHAITERLQQMIRRAASAASRPPIRKSTVIMEETEHGTMMDVATGLEYDDDGEQIAF